MGWTERHRALSLGFLRCCLNEYDNQTWSDLLSLDLKASLSFYSSELGIRVWGYLLSGLLPTWLLHLRPDAGFSSHQKPPSSELIFYWCSTRLQNRALFYFSFFFFLIFTIEIPY